MMIIVQVCYIISEVTDILHVVFATGMPSYICPEHAYVTSSGEDTYKRSWNKGISIHKQDFLLSFPYMDITKRLWDDKNLMFNFEAFENLNGADGGISDQMIMVVMHKSVWYSVQYMETFISLVCTLYHKCIQIRRVDTIWHSCEYTHCVGYSATTGLWGHLNRDPATYDKWSAAGRHFKWCFLLSKGPYNKSK